MNDKIEELITQPMEIKLMLSEILNELKLINTYLNQILEINE